MYVLNIFNRIEIQSTVVIYIYECNEPSMALSFSKHRYEIFLEMDILQKN